MRACVRASVSVCLSVYVCGWVCVSVSMFVYVCVYVRACVFVVSACVCVRVCVYVPACLSACLPTCLPVCLPVRNEGSGMFYGASVVLLVELGPPHRSASQVSCEVNLVSLSLGRSILAVCKETLLSFLNVMRRVRVCFNLFPTRREKREEVAYHVLSFFLVAYYSDLEGLKKPSLSSRQAVHT